MSQAPVHPTAARHRPAMGFSLLELLVVVAITAIMIAILLPSLSAARETANITRCLANLREITAAAATYMEDEGLPTQPWHLGFNQPGGTLDAVSEFVYGGFQVVGDNPVYGEKVDVRKIQTHSRPFNRYIAPGLCDGPVKSYICPSDSYSAASSFKGPCVPPRVVKMPSWQIFGNSYAMNWNWLNGEPWNDKSEFYQDIHQMTLAGQELLRRKVGAPASEFVLFMENPMNGYMNNGRPKGGSGIEPCVGELGQGWHARFSRYSVGFFDGHVEHRFFDTRYSKDTGYNLWPEPLTRKGF